MKRHYIMMGFRDREREIEIEIERNKHEKALYYDGYERQLMTRRKSGNTPFLMKWVCHLLSLFLTWSPPDFIIYIAYYILYLTVIFICHGGGVLVN